MDQIEFGSILLNNGYDKCIVNYTLKLSFCLASKHCSDGTVSQLRNQAL